MLDLLIRNALVFDGSGAEPAVKDVAIQEGKIRAIGRSLSESATQVVDADGLALMPGIIDSHTHFDAQITWDPYVRPSPSLGVLRGGIAWGFETFAQYMAQLRRRGSAVNIAAYIGHSSVRTYVMGKDASTRAATDDEIAQMRQIVREAMRSGAVGFASSTSPAHNGEGGLPMPSRLAEDCEMAALVNAMGEAGQGVYMLTKGGHTAMPFLESLAASSGRPVMIAALLHNSTNPQAVFNDLDDIAQANTRGRRLIGQVSCCPLTMDFTLASPYPVEGLQRWKPALGLTGVALKKVL